MTTLIDRMERAGLVERVSDEEDRRINNISTLGALTHVD
ncbi:MarR family transcriptional regulator [Candidatus Formimonas warabiya]